jgi:ubiquinone/menaquinone biosynthesis C-methylase UbiE
MAHHHVCPWWLGRFHTIPIRRLVEKPERIVGSHLAEGMTALDVGCGMGFFALPMAQMVGTTGKVIAVDIQPKMLSGLRRRATKAGLVDRVVVHPCEASSLKLDEYGGAIDFGLAFAVVHEVPDREVFFAELGHALAPHGKLLVVEPPGRVTVADFGDTLAAAAGKGFTVVDRPMIRGKTDRSALLARRA